MAYFRVKLTKDVKYSKEYFVKAKNEYSARRMVELSKDNFPMEDWELDYSKMKDVEVKYLGDDSEYQE
jgi:hypothetical protein